MDKTNNQNRDYFLKKIKDLRAAGINPYPARAKRTHTCLEVEEDFKKLSKKKIILAGRLKLLRRHGGATFGHLEDATAKFQIFFGKDKIGDEQYKMLKNFDIGDFIQVEGKLFKTQKGEKTLEVRSYKLLSKAIRPLPEKWHGIKDEEERLRKRYLDLQFNPELREMFIRKSIFWDTMRNFLKDNGFTEVETPVLEVTPGGADANPFITHHNALDIDLYLRISMGELWQKRLMVAGFEKTFEIGRQFRNEGIDAEHLQDYTQMEFYMAYANYEDGMELCEKMYKEIIKKTFGTMKFEIKGFKLDFSKKWEKIDYVETIEKELKINVLDASEKDLREKAKKLGLNFEDKIGRGRLVDLLWKQVRKNIAGPAFLINHPVEVSPLAKRKEDDDRLVERFQIIIAGSELGNGYSELNDPIDQASRFEEQAKLREEGDDEAQMHDQDFVEALEYGMPPTCGFGLSERLFAFLEDKPIRETVLFPLMRPKGGQQVVSSKSEKVYLKMTRDEAWDLLNKHLKDEQNILHSRETEVIMRALAERLGEDVEFWGMVGLLHDLDWGKTKDNPEEHSKLTEEILREHNFPETGIKAIRAHNYEHAGGDERSTKLDHALASAETITGLIFAAALVNPEKKLSAVKVKSIKKKMKDKSFAAKVNRDMIRESEKLGLELGEFIEISLKAMQEISDELGL